MEQVIEKTTEIKVEHEEQQVTELSLDMLDKVGGGVLVALL
jgi:hypothetical protein